MLKLFKFKHFGPLERKKVWLRGELVNIAGFGFLPRLKWRHRRWLGIARVSIAEPPAQARQHTANRMQKNYKGKGKTMTEQNEHDQTEKLLNALAEIGAGSFKAECRNDVSRWRKIGMAISHTGNYGRECYELANTVAEDWNWHSMVAIVDFLLGKQPWDHTINYLKNGIEGAYTVRTYDCKDRKVKLSLTIEDIQE